MTAPNIVDSVLGDELAAVLMNMNAEQLAQLERTFTAARMTYAASLVRQAGINNAGDEYLEYFKPSTITTAEVYANIKADKYYIKGRLAIKVTEAAEREAQRKEAQALAEQFKVDALKATNLYSYPRADKLFKLAYNEGHSYGLHEVLTNLIDIADALGVL